MQNMQSKEFFPLKSKKFLAYLIAELSSKLLMAWLITHIGTLDIYELSLLMTMVLSSSALTIGYILGVASLEKYLSSAVDILDKEDQSLKAEIALLKEDKKKSEK
jgi:hypothetical protein